MDKFDIIIGGAAGKMGHVIAELASKADDIDGIYLIDKSYENFSFDREIALLRENSKLNHPGTVYIDFTDPGATVIDNIKNMSEAGVDSVIGTTGWYDKMEEMQNIAKHNDRRILWSPNFSIGVNVTFALVDYASKILGKYGFDAGEFELHHTGKKDTPSGTAEELGKILIKNIPGKEIAVYNTERKKEVRPDNAVDIVGARVGSVTGYHKVVLSPNSGDYERLTIEHDARDRNTFGMGALVGARWTYKAGKDGKEPGLYTFFHNVLEL